MTLYEYVIVGHPTKEDAENDVPPELLVKPTFTFAKGRDTVKLEAAGKIPEEWRDKLNRIEVLIWPFTERTSMCSWIAFDPAK